MNLRNVAGHWVDLALTNEQHGDDAVVMGSADNPLEEQIPTSLREGEWVPCEESL
jgi:hypothetical protein